MLKELFKLGKQILSLARDTDKNKSEISDLHSADDRLDEEIDELQKEDQRLASLIRELASAADHDRELAARDRENLLLRLELALTRAVRSMPAVNPVPDIGDTVVAAGSLIPSLVQSETASSVVGKVLSREELNTALEARRGRGERIVFTNGCFDILHVGHARYLAQARALGDLLVVGMNSDASVRGLKGPQRPVVPEQERAEVLAHLASVDYVCLFDESRPDALIEVVRPDIHVKGGDYREEDLPEAAVVRKHGGRVVIMPLVEGRSTSDLIARVIDAYGAP